MPKLLAPLFNPGIYAGVLLTALLMVAAYQVRPTYDIPIGTPIDGVLLRGFNDRETAQGDNPLRFRWSSGNSYITLHDVGRQDFDVVLTVSGARPPGQLPAHFEVAVGDKTLVKADPPPEPTDYSFSVPRELVADGTLTLRITSNAFTPPGDPRELGILVTHLRVSPSRTLDRFVEPPLGPIAWVVAAVALFGFALSFLGWGVGGVAVGTGLLGGLAGGLLAFDRLWLTQQGWYTAWLQSVIAGIALLLLFGPLAGWLLRLGGVPLVGLAGGLLAFDRLWLTQQGWYTGWLQSIITGIILLLLFGPLAGWLLRLGGVPLGGEQHRVLLTLILTAFVVKFAGQMHPQIFIVDLGFHVNRFALVEQGQLLFTHVSSEIAGRRNPYLPTTYIFMQPFQWLLHDTRLVVKLFTVGLGSLGVLPLYYLGKRALGDGRAALLACALYLSVPIAILPYSWGLSTNVFGDFFALTALAVLVGAYPKLGLRHPAFWALLILFLIAILSHPAVVQLVAVAFGSIALLWLLSKRLKLHRRQAWWVLGTLFVAALLAYGLYYYNFAGMLLDTVAQLQAERADKDATEGFRRLIGGAVMDRSLGLVTRFATTPSDWFWGGLRGLWQEAQSYYRVWPLAGAAIGYTLAWVSARGRAATRQSSFVLAALGWLLAVALFALVGWVLNLYVRYSLFALPVLALGAGILLSRTWRRGRYGALLGLLVVAYFVVEALALWQHRINYALK